MGCAASTQSEGVEAHQRSVAIDKLIEQAASSRKREVNILLLGAGEAGKTTVLKQMQLLHKRNCQSTFGDSERIQTRLKICDGMTKLDIPYGNPENARQKFILSDGGPDFIPVTADAIRALWNDTGIQECYRRSNEYQLHDTAKYNRLHTNRPRHPGMSHQDNGHTRQVSLLIMSEDGVEFASVAMIAKVYILGEFIFEEEKLTLRVVDVGGQRSERRKWVSCFEDITATIFVAAISEYDQVLQEDESKNRMEEAIRLFDQIINSRWFLTTHVILFLNKVDILETKYQERGDDSIKRHWPDYKGTSLEDAINFFKARFLEVNGHKNKMIHAHTTCATDQESIAVVIESVKLMLMRNDFADIGLF
ncbi:hypothetical protein SeLEV6574_g05852 [Synchytrium endobioticum]|uniref:Uncharacterized protein n=1 Tax=Synchytrium endobioticum TaxID=286115 RepID=A0A507CS12_9FUNG|nr:hypothetical protein SeLEV6574_g05852 [Synchytrium endobioticum]